MIILDGKKISEEIKAELKEKIQKIKEPLKLVIIQVGDKPDSNIYIKRKIDFANEIGVNVEVKKFEESIQSENLKEEIEKLNRDIEIKGIIVQLPLPKHLESEKIVDCISASKDVDGMLETNIYRIFYNKKPFILPATIRGIETILKKYNIKVLNKKVCVIGDSFYVGKPIAKMFENSGSKVVVCNEETKDLPSITKYAEILVSAVGKPGIVTDEFVNENQIIIDVGISFDENGKLKGDVQLKEKEVYAITPVPGGVGPMTVASLFQNLIERVL